MAGDSAAFPASSVAAPGGGRAPVRGFNLIEIAICLAVIAFAILAIMGILPFGIDAQRENRNETLINQDAAYWLEAIRNGAQGLDDLTNYVERIIVDGKEYCSPYLLNPQPATCQGTFTDGSNIVGLLTTTNLTNTAYAYAISGAAIEKDPASDGRPLGFKYQMLVEIVDAARTAQDALNPVLELTNLYELRLSFLYPLGPNDAPGGGRRTLRAQAARTVRVVDPAGPEPRYFLTR